MSPSVRQRPSSFPWISTSLCALALSVWLIPGANETLQFDRAALTQGELWRVLTGHFTHWTAGHLGWDVAAFGLLGALVERHSRRLLFATLAAGALAISAGVWIVHPELATYRGLSGLDSALFATVTTRMVLLAAHERRWLNAAWPALAAAAFVAKTVVEFSSATTLFVASDASFVPVSLAHAIGGVTGVVTAALSLGRPKFRPTAKESDCSDRPGKALTSPREPFGLRRI